MKLRTFEDFQSAVVDRVVQHAPGIVTGILVFLFFWFLSRLSRKVLKRLFARADTDPAIANLALPLVRWAFVAIGVLAAVEQMGFNVGSLLAGVGIAGLAIGLAAQETLANLLAGFLLLWDRPFRIGDTVTISGVNGTVTGIGLRSTRLRTLEQREVTLPNKEVAATNIVNHSSFRAIRHNVPFSIGYRESVARVRELLLAAVAQDPGALREPAPQVVVTALGESGVALELRVWVATPVADSASLFWYLELVHATLGRAGVEIPFPQRTLHLTQPVQIATGGGAPR
jgi:small conductance mechanosensitive channel